MPSPVTARLPPTSWSAHLQRILQQGHVGSDIGAALSAAQQSRLVPGKCRGCGSRQVGECQLEVRTSAAAGSRPGKAQRADGSTAQRGAACTHSRSVLSSSSASHTPMAVLFSWEKAVACGGAPAGTGGWGRGAVGWQMATRLRNRHHSQHLAPWAAHTTAPGQHPPGA